jgi:DNA-binding GntR family transcriptional regulator
VTEWAGPNLSPASLDKLQQVAEQITQARRTPEGVASSLELNRVFHFTIYAAAGSPVMLRMIENLWLQSGAYLRDKREVMHTGELAADLLHESTIAAMRQGDFAKARALIQSDVQWVFDRLALDDIPVANT